MKISTILKRAKHKIRKPELWGQGIFRNGDVMCSLAAIADASRRFENREKCRALFRRANRIKVILYWNDAKCRTHSQVMRAFDKAIKLAEKEEAAKCKSR